MHAPASILCPYQLLLCCLFPAAVSGHCVAVCPGLHACWSAEPAPVGAQVGRLFDLRAACLWRNTCCRNFQADAACKCVDGVCGCAGHAWSMQNCTCQCRSADGSTCRRNSMPCCLGCHPSRVQNAACMRNPAVQHPHLMPLQEPCSSSPPPAQVAAHGAAAVPAAPAA